MPRHKGKLAIPPEVVVEHEDKAWDLRIKGYTQRAIAKELKISQSAVCQILGRLHERYRSSLDQDVARVQEEQILILQNIIYQALDAWENDLRYSKQGTTSRDPAYITSALAALADIRKITGIKPKDDSDDAGNSKNALAAIVGILDAAAAKSNSAPN